MIQTALKLETGFTHWCRSELRSSNILISFDCDSVDAAKTPHERRPETTALGVGMEVLRSVKASAWSYSMPESLPEQNVMDEWRQSQFSSIT
jgi:hypothetical protein